jgi:hypothetical protein
LSEQDQISYERMTTNERDLYNRLDSQQQWDYRRMTPDERWSFEHDR